MSATGQRNTKMRDLLAADFLLRNDPSLAFSRAIPTLQYLPGIRMILPFSSINTSGAFMDMSGHSNGLSGVGSPTADLYGLASYVNLDGTTQYLTVSTLSLHPSPSIQGGAWFRCNRATGTLETLFSYIVASNGYIVQRLATGEITFSVNNGAKTITTTELIVQDAWTHVAFQWVASTSMTIWINGVAAATSTTSIPASITRTSQSFRVGADGSGTTLLDGQVALVFVSVRTVTENHIQICAHHSKALFGK